MDSPRPTPPPPPSPRPPPSLPASLPPLPDEEMEPQPAQQVQSPQQTQPAQQQPRMPTPPPAQPKTAVPVPPPLPTLRRSGPSDWDAGELRRLDQELEAKHAALEAAGKRKDGEIATWTRKASAEAAARERAQALAAGLEERGRRLEEEYGEMVAAVERLQPRVRALRANERRMETEVGRQVQQSREAAGALRNARRLLAANDARVHELEGQRLEGERQALRLQLKVFELKRALEKEVAAGQRKASAAAATAVAAAAVAAAAEEAPRREDRPPPTVPATKAKEPDSGDAGLAQILEANRRLQEELRRTKPAPPPAPPVAKQSTAKPAPLPLSPPSSITTEEEAVFPSTTRVRPPGSPSTMLGSFPRSNSPKPPRRASPPPSAQYGQHPPATLRLYGFDARRVQQATAAARGEAQRRGLGHQKQLSWAEASTILRVLHQHRGCPRAETFPCINVLTCVCRNSTIDQPLPVLRAFLRALGEGTGGP